MLQDIQDVRLRISVLGLFVKSDFVLMIHKINGPEPDRWDLPGGGLQPGEPIEQALQREIQEETGIVNFQIEGVLTVVEKFFPNWQGKYLHSLNIIYKCSVQGDPVLRASDREVGAKGIQWLHIANLSAANCSTRSWKALQVASRGGFCA